ncbi:unnamed protein product [Lepeophtheirus salmonis]|uniref:Kinetochore protein NDC80 n=1 Tax=Lepeophtheirus salmonis TaxID=72036 RepID=A0A7R8HCF0_LEPSM|nr:unnamed protein product [Lepeophtheirus salmonis]CAF2988822.1 unnamed protein product [Lepeophtheirus salmonis]
MQGRNSVSGRSMGPDVRKRSSSRNRNSQVKTPHFSGQVTAYVEFIAENTLRIQEHKIDSLKSLIDFLREHNNYSNRELTSKSFPLSASEFRCLFNFMYGILSPGYVLPQKFESELTSLLKGLDYPGVISSQHSSLWITTLMAYQSFFVKVDENGQESEDMEMILSKRSKKLESKLLDRLDLNPQDLQNLIKKRDQLKETFDSIKAETNLLDSLRQKKELMAKDREYFMDYKAKYIKYTEKKTNELQNMKKKNETLLDEIKTLEQTIELKNNDSGGEELTPENYKARCDSLERIYSNINKEIRITDEDICALEIQISKLKVKSDVVIREFNINIEKLEEFSLPKISDL